MFQNRWPIYIGFTGRFAPDYAAGVRNTILHFERTSPSQEFTPILAKRWGNKADDFDSNIKLLDTDSQKILQESIFRADTSASSNNFGNFVLFGNICYVSTGLRPWFSSATTNVASFVTDDLVQNFKDSKHPKTWIESKDVVKWTFQQIRYLEWGTKRAPEKFESQTFPEFYNAPEKVLTKDISTLGIEVAYDNKQYLPSHTAYCCVPWHYLKCVINQSIKKTAKYKHQNPLGDREARENISKKFNLKYVLAIMNSSFTKNWMAENRRSKMHIYPDDWKKLPIAPISLEEQKEFVKLVDKILAEYEKHGYPLPEKSAQKLRDWEGQLDEMVSRLYEEEGVT